MSPDEWDEIESSLSHASRQVGRLIGDAHDEYADAVIALDRAKDRIVSLREFSSNFNNDDEKQ